MDFIAVIAIIFSFALVLLAAIFLWMEVYMVIIGQLKGAPYVKSGKRRIALMLDLAAPKPGDRVVDLGSGDGTLLIAAAQRGASAFGVEINPFLVWLSRYRAKKLGLQDAIQIKKGDFRTYPLASMDVVFVYLWPTTLEKLREKLLKELKPGARIISNSFPIAGFTPIMEREGVYKYMIAEGTSKNDI